MECPYFCIMGDVKTNIGKTKFYTNTPCVYEMTCDFTTRKAGNITLTSARP